MTDVGGHYRFDDLAPGDYTIVVDQGSLPAVVDGQSYDPDTVTDSRHDVTLTAGENEAAVDFGYESVQSPGPEPVTPPITPPVGPVSPGEPVAPVAPPATSALPRTGMDPWTPGRLALALMGLGLGLLAVSRRRRPA